MSVCVCTMIEIRSESECNICILAIIRWCTARECTIWACCSLAGDRILKLLRVIQRNALLSVIESEMMIYNASTMPAEIRFGTERNPFFRIAHILFDFLLYAPGSCSSAACAIFMRQHIIHKNMEQIELHLSDSRRASVMYSYAFSHGTVTFDTAAPPPSNAQSINHHYHPQQQQQRENGKKNEQLRDIDEKDTWHREQPNKRQSIMSHKCVSHRLSDCRRWLRRHMIEYAARIPRDLNAVAIVVATHHERINRQVARHISMWFTHVACWLSVYIKRILITTETLGNVLDNAHTHAQ